MARHTQDRERGEAGSGRFCLRLLALAAILVGFCPPAFPQEAEYAGSESCQVCHEDIYNSFQQSTHAGVETDTRRGWEGRACESCHGPGSKHTETMEAGEILNPLTMEPLRADEKCLQCHLNQPTHIGRVRGSHARNQVSCTACHSTHSEPPPKTGGRRFQAKINQECAECHTGSWASFQRPHAHKLLQGAMSCLDCHNPHGSFLPKSMQTAQANEPGCMSCHGDKRGPFVFEHAPMRLEGCGACHEPHGSANPRMLTRHNVSNLCLECHANIVQPGGTSVSGALGGIPTGFHDLGSARFQNCTLCHVKIHGSHVNRDFLR